MRTTIDLPDDLMRQAKATAALRGLKLRELIERCLERGLREGISEASPAERPRRKLPGGILPASGRTLPSLSNAELQAILDNEDAVRG